MIISQDDIMRLSDTDNCTMHCNKHIIFHLIAFWDNFIEVQCKCIDSGFLSLQAVTK